MSENGKNSIFDEFDLIFKNLLDSEIEKNKCIFEGLICALISEYGNKVENPNSFDILVNYKISQALDAYILELLKDEISENANNYEILFFYREYRFMKNNIEKLIIKAEGSPCCADKSRWIMNNFRNYLLNGDIFEMKNEEDCYWKPKFGTGEKWIDFCNSLIELHHGRPDRYILSLRALISNDEGVLN